MNNLSFAIMDGRLTHDPETKKVKDNLVVTKFQLALNHSRGNSDENRSVSFIPVETWGRLAETCGTYLKKGRHVTVQGVFRQDRWRDGEGNMRSQIKIVAENVRFDSFGESKKEYQKAA